MILPIREQYFPCWIPLPGAGVTGLGPTGHGRGGKMVRYDCRPLNGTSQNLLKETHFHGKMIYPLHVRVTFDRQPIYFKSYYFDLFSKPRYVIFMDGKIHGPRLTDIIKIETQLLEFVIDKNLPEFFLDIFKKDYAYYSKDLCDIM
jgi:hypothetical protein